MRPILSLLLLFCFTPMLPQQKATRKRIKPFKTVNLDGQIPEGSGLAAWNGQLWTHNDSGSPKLFALDSATGKIVSTYKLPGTANRDWEELAQDSLYFYLGDIGNNLGKITAMQILRIEKQSLLQHKPKIDSITFRWPETAIKGRKKQINYNAEAMVIVGDSLFLFTKEWQKKRRTQLFSLPKLPGNYLATYKSELKTRVLITGASYDSNSRKLVLCGYTLWLRTFLLVFPNVAGTDFFSGKCVKVKVTKRFRQTEGIATLNGLDYYLINEDFKFLFVHTHPELQQINLSKAK